MHVADKLDVLSAGAKYDLACACGDGAHRVRGPMGRWVYPAVLPGGRSVRLLKVLLSNSCSRNCLYCPQRRGRDFTRLSFRPEELAATYMEMYRAGAVTGLFLSSAIGESAEADMERLLQTVEVLRCRHRYSGWLHLKVMPGARREQVERAAALANRLSLNLEAPTAERLKKISPQKRFQADIYNRMGWISELIAGASVRCRGQTTQLVVGAGGETDAEFIRLAGRLYKEVKLSRIYYSAFQPVPGTPLADRPPASFEREHRLYQTDFLLRKYGFRADELVLDEEGNLPLKTDPKSAWAGVHPEFFPVEIDRASQAELLRVPGIGPVAAGRIVKQRGRGRFASLDDLRRAGALAERSAPYILLGGKRPGELRGAQLSLL